MRRWWAGLLLVLAGTTAAQNGKPCSAPEQREFDFWIGRWEVFTPDGKKAGDNHIEAIDGGCALLERWKGSRGFSGTSLNSWNARTRQWLQHWVDNQGGLLRLAGELEGNRMVLVASEPHPARIGGTLRQRITWTPQADGSVRQHWEKSEDYGLTWTTAFDGRYVRTR